MSTLEFEAIYQGRPISAYLDPHGIFVYHDVDEGEDVFGGSIRIYFNPEEVQIHPYNISDGGFEQSVNQFILDTFGVDPYAGYSEQGRQGRDYVDFDIGDAQPFYYLANNPNYRMYITLNRSEY